MAGDEITTGDPELDAALAARHERQRRAAARRSGIVFAVGAVVTVVGAGLWIGNVTGAFPTVPLAGYLTIVFGGFICTMSRRI